MQKAHKDRIFQVVKVIFPLFLLVLAALEIQKIGINLDLLRSEVSQLQIWEMALVFIISICAITPMFLYDVMLVKLLKIRIPARKLVKQSFIINTFSNLIGFGGLAGLMLRNYYYGKHNRNKQSLLKTIASVTLFAVTGISLFASVMLIGYRNFPLLNEIKWLYFAVLAISLLLPLYILFNLFPRKRKSDSTLSFSFIVRLVSASVLEWTAVFFVIWFLTYVLSIPIQVTDLIPIFIIASCAWIASLIPGGIGSFDLVFLWGTQSLGILDEKIIVLLIFYRAGYFVLPFLISVVLFMKEYWVRSRQFPG